MADSRAVSEGQHDPGITDRKAHGRGMVRARVVIECHVRGSKRTPIVGLLEKRGLRVSSLKSVVVRGPWKEVCRVITV